MTVTGSRDAKMVKEQSTIQTGKAYGQNSRKTFFTATEQFMTKMAKNLLKRGEHSVAALIST